MAKMAHDKKEPSNIQKEVTPEDRNSIQDRLLEETCFFPKQFTVRGSQCFKEWSPWCWMVWSGSRPACLPLPFICLPVLFICLPGWVLVVGFPPASFHSPNSLLLRVLNALAGSRLVSHFLSLSPSFFSFPKQFTVTGSQCFKEWSPWCWMVWSGSRLACLPLPFICLPLLFIPQTVYCYGFSMLGKEPQATRPQAPSLGDK